MPDSPFVHLPTPIQSIQSKLADRAGVQWMIKRDDLIHPQISGNKWRKLKYNLQYAKEQGFSTLLTFGGAYSNHIYAVAAAGILHGFHTIGIIRGEEPIQLSETLQFAKSCKMQLEFWPRHEYSLKNNSELFDIILKKYGSFYMIPEGGSNALAVKGCAEIINEIQIPFDYICCACGTGSTIAGLIAGLNNEKKALGISALKGGSFLRADIRSLLQHYYFQQNLSQVVPENWEIETGYHFGGYAKITEELLSFIRRFKQENNFQIEQVYTAKMLAAVEDLIKKGQFQRGETIISLHTGGLQGRMPEL